MILAFPSDVVGGCGNMTIETVLLHDCEPVRVVAAELCDPQVFLTGISWRYPEEKMFTMLAWPDMAVVSLDLLKAGHAERDFRIEGIPRLPADSTLRLHFINRLPHDQRICVCVEALR
jgi:hypothetical protein